MASYAVILPAAGKSARFGHRHYKKTFVPLGGRPVWLHAAQAFADRKDVKQQILVIAPEDREEFQRKFAGNAAFMGIEVVEGGGERFESVENGLAKVRTEIEYVAIHDAARPCLAPQWIDRVFQDAARTGAAILAVPAAATLKRAKAGGKVIEQTVSRSDMWEAQTPQVFRRDWLLDAFSKRAGQKVTDEAQLVELAGYDVYLTTGSSLNLKITTKEDLKLAQMILKVLPKPDLLGPPNPLDDLRR